MRAGIAPAAADPGFSGGNSLPTWSEDLLNLPVRAVTTVGAALHGGRC